jgi:hypothetical protein
VDIQDLPPNGTLPSGSYIAPFGVRVLLKRTTSFTGKLLNEKSIFSGKLYFPFLTLANVICGMNFRTSSSNPISEVLLSIALNISDNFSVPSPTPTQRIFALLGEGKAPIFFKETSKGEN